MNPGTRAGVTDLPKTTDVVIAGGGIVGISLAYWLARDGIEVVVVDKRDLHSQASAGNAGTLHQQLMTTHLAARGWEWFERSAAATVPYMVAAGRTWQELAASLDDDIELNLSGGLLLGETPEDMKILERKVSLERRVGGTTELIGRDTLRQHAPYISDRFAGAAFCANEGQLNPLKAAPALYRAAQKAGAQFVRHAAVKSVDRTNLGFAVVTEKGAIRCRRFVNAAGSASPEIAALLGIRYPFVAMPRQNLVTEAVAPILTRVFYHARLPFGLKQTRNGNFIAGGGWDAVYDANRDSLFTLAESIRGNIRLVRDLFPASGDLSLLRAWACLISQPDDGLSIVSEVPGQPSHYILVPNAIGFTLAPLLARLMGEIIARRAPSMDVSPLKLDRSTLVFQTDRMAS